MQIDQTAFPACSFPAIAVAGKHKSKRKVVIDHSISNRTMARNITTYWNFLSHVSTPRDKTEVDPPVSFIQGIIDNLPGSAEASDG